MKCGWMDWSASDYTDSLDLKALEDLFGMQENKQKQEPGKFKVTLHEVLVLVIICMHCCSEEKG